MTIDKNKLWTEITSRDFLMGFATGMLSNILCGLFVVLIMRAKRA